MRDLLPLDVLLCNMTYQNQPFMIELPVKLTLSEHHTMYLDEKEDESAKVLVGAASIGYPKTVCEVTATVGAIVARKQGLEVATVSQGW